MIPTNVTSWSLRALCLALMGSAAVSLGSACFEHVPYLPQEESGDSSSNPSAGSGLTTGSAAGGCTGEFADCEGVCVAIAVDPKNCGKCGTACAPGDLCTQGACVPCGGFATRCGEACVDTQVDPNHCGACDQACTAGELCSAGMCAATCARGTTQCGEVCTNTTYDPANCGECGVVCASGPNALGICNGVCSRVCKDGYGDCDASAGNGCEVDIGTSPANCGACGVLCPAAANGKSGCKLGVCGLESCNPGYADCDAMVATGCEINLTVDKNNCGVCNKACAAGESCSNGLCIKACVIAAVGTPTNHISVGSTQGQWNADPTEKLGAGKLWTMDSYGGTTVNEYASLAALKNNTVTTSFNMPSGWDGTGAVVNDGHVYYNKANTRNMIKYDLGGKTQVLDVLLPNAGFRNMYPYQWGGYSDIDFAVDENGLWVLYATPASGGNIVISKLDPANLNIVQSWTTGHTKNTGNAFMICGVLYTIASYGTLNSTLDYKYDTALSTGMNISIPFTNPGNYNSMVAYNPKEKILYSWDASRHQTYPLTF